MKKIFTLLLVMLLGAVVNINAKSKVTTLWESTYTGGNIEIPVASLVQGATITVSASVTASENADDKKLRIFYCKNDAKWTQTSFSDISDWVELTTGETSHSFTVTEAAMNILNDNTETTGSRGIMYIGANNSSYVTISKITMTETLTPTSTGANLLTDNWASSKETAKILSAVSNAKIGDVLQFTVSTTKAWNWVQFKLTDKDGNVDQFSGEGSELQGNNGNTSFTLEFVISNLGDLKKIKNDGFGFIQTGDNAFTLTAVNLLSYSDSYGYITITIGGTGYATFSAIEKYDFASAGINAYCALSVGKGVVNLTPKDITWDYKGYILKGTPGTYDVMESLTTDGSYYPGDNNYLKYHIDAGDVSASTGSTYHYIFAKSSNESQPSFYKITSDHNLGANKAYLETNTDISDNSSGARGITLDFGDGTTAIFNIIEDDDVIRQDSKEGIYYTLQGVQVQKPTKGLYILNGKKVLVK